MRWHATRGRYLVSNSRVVKHSQSLYTERKPLAVPFALSHRIAQEADVLQETQMLQGLEVAELCDLVVCEYDCGEVGRGEVYGGRYVGYAVV